MLSTCPSCLSQVLHEDSSNDVTCECGVHFSPYLSVGDSIDLPPAQENKAVPSSSLNQNIAAGAHSFGDYAESESVFADIRSFGESLENSQEDLSAMEAQLPHFKEAPKGSTAPIPPQTPLATSQMTQTLVGLPELERLLTSGDSLPGYQIVSFLTPLSLWCAADPQAEDPLKAAFEVLGQKASLQGANGVIAIRWSFTPDGSRILLSGTPVKCQKNP